MRTDIRYFEYKKMWINRKIADTAAIKKKTHLFLTKQNKKQSYSDLNRSQFKIEPERSIIVTLSRGRDPCQQIHCESRQRPTMD